MNSLTKKVLILVTVPLALQLGLLVRFACVQNYAQIQLAEARKASTTARLLNRLHSNIYGLLIEFHSSSFKTITPENLNSALDAAAKSSKQIDGDLRALKETAGDDPEIVHLVDTAKQFKHRGIVTILKLADPGIQMDTRTAERKQLEGVLNDIISQAYFSLFPAFTHKMDSYADNQYEIQSGISREERNFMVACALLDLVITASVAVLLTRTLTMRLQKLDANTIRLAKGEPLSPPDEGKDEIGHLDQSFRSMASALAEAERAKREITAMVTHDLRTPLTTVGNIVESLESKAATEKDKAYFDTARKNIDRMIQLVGDLLDLEKARDGKLQLETSEFAVADLFVTARQATEAFAAGLEVRLSFEETALLASGNFAASARVLQNLISNAAKFSPSNSAVRVSCSENEDRVVVSVADDGPGIPAEDRGIIFERFTQSSAAVQSTMSGSGLGLAICRALVEAQGGKIWVDSAPGKGSMFSFSLPKKCMPANI